MNTEIRDLWADALESGEYKQGRKNLRVGDKYCCLGVLCMLAVDAGVCTYSKSSNATVPVTFGVTNVTGSLPFEVVEWAELPPPSPVIKHGGRYDSFIDLNDNQHKTFTEIAKLIREYA